MCPQVLIVCQDHRSERGSEHGGAWLHPQKDEEGGQCFPEAAVKPDLQASEGIADADGAGPGGENAGKGSGSQMVKGLEHCA